MKLFGVRPSSGAAMPARIEAPFGNGLFGETKNQSPFTTTAPCISARNNLWPWLRPGRAHSGYMALI
jgi:hypothetical protein